MLHVITAVSEHNGVMLIVHYPQLRAAGLVRTPRPRGGQLAFHEKGHTPEALLQVLSLSPVDRGFVKSA